MKFLRKKQSSSSLSSNEILNPLVAGQGYSIEPFIVISMPDRMIVRVKLRMPVNDSENIEIAALNEGCDEISMKCVLLGKHACVNDACGLRIFKELVFSVFVPYPEQDLILEVRNLKNKEVIYQQLVEAEVIKNQRAKDDQVFYRFAEDDPTYTEWLTKEHRPSEYELEVQRNTKLYYEPKFSIVVPLYKTPINFFNELIECIRNQTYSNWELILVNASPENAELVQATYFACQLDSQIKLIELEKNEGITLNTAYGINASQGDFVCFVDHDDVLEPNCLFEYAQAINNNPRAELLYCDEDLLLSDGSYSCAYFKPDFNEFQLRTSNYACHMLSIKRDLLMQLEYDNPSYDGAQDHHLTLQASEKAKAIEHVSKVLYHWRMSETSVAGAGSEKPYAVEAGLRAVSTHLERIGVRARVQSHEEILLTTRIDYELPDALPRVSIIIPARDGSNFSPCIKSVLEITEYPNYEVIVISEQEATLGDFIDDERVAIYDSDITFNYSEYVNEGRNEAKGKFLIILGDNARILTSKWIESLLGICIQPEVGIVGGKILLADDTLESAGLFVGDEPYPYFQNLPNGAITFKDYAKQVRNVSAVSTVCMMTDTEVFDKVGGFNTELGTELAGVDFCFKVTERKKQIVYTPYAEVRHFVLPSYKCSCMPQDKELAIKEMGTLMSCWPKKFAESDSNQNANIAQSWRGAYFSLRD